MPVSRPCVLIADDDPLIVATLGHALRAADFEVIEAHNAASAFDACVAHSPALAIVDYSMPGANGVELASRVANETAVAVIFLSAYGDDAIVREAIAAGAMTYLVKPIDTLQLVPAVRTAIERSKELRALRCQADQLSSALKGGRNVSIVTGLLMEKYQIGQQEALERLRRQARSTRTRLEVLATEVLRVADDAGKIYETLSRSTAQEPARTGEKS
ncbi:MAG: response regulator [Gammaproteobacteria bacterium]